MSEHREDFDLAGDQPASTRIMVALATMSERQKAMMRQNEDAKIAADTQHRELMARIDTFVPRSEIEKDNKAIHVRIDELDARIERVDGKIWKGVVGVLGALGTLVLGAVSLHFKGGSG